MTSPSTEALRILVVDDEYSFFEGLAEDFSSLGDRIFLDYAHDANSASKKFESTFYDLVILDVYGTNHVTVGLEVHRRMTTGSLSARAMFVSSFGLEGSFEKLLDLTASVSAGQLAGFVDKRNNTAPESIRRHVMRELARFEQKIVHTTGLEVVSEAIVGKRQRYRSRDGLAKLRKNPDEVAVEIERVMRDLFGLSEGAERQSQVHVELTPVERHGLSAAVAVNAFVRVTFSDVNPESAGHHIVLKFGPKEDALAEASRFYEYVRFGVELAQRVELLGVGARDVIGGLAYSYAGQKDGSLTSLDEELLSTIISANTDLSRDVLESLFTTREWYSVTCSAVRVARYFEHNYRSDLLKSCAAGESMLVALNNYEGSGIRIDAVPSPKDRTAIRVSSPTGVQFPVPGSAILGWGFLSRKVPACLVHGDLHGGNVFIESFEANNGDKAATILDRTRLIDFRNSGPGPRCVDAVALESSIRLADAKSWGGRLESQGEPSGQSAAGAIAMLDRTRDDEALYRAIFQGVGDVPDSVTAQLSAVVLLGLRSCFADVTLQEYLSTSVRYTLRMLGFKLDPLTRCRITAWLGAQYRLAVEIEPKGHSRN